MLGGGEEGERSNRRINKSERRAKFKNLGLFLGLLRKKLYLCGQIKKINITT